MKVCKQSRRRRAATQSVFRNSLRLEHLEGRRVFAGLAPVAANDAYDSVAGELLEVELSGVLTNDTDPEGDELTALEFQGPSHGALTLSADGSFLYEADEGFTGIDGFIYQASDGENTSRLAAVTIRVNAENAPPMAADDAYSMPEDGLLALGATGGLLANDADPDGDTMTVEIVDQPQHGRLALDADGGFTYQPEADFHGTDSFTYVVSDGQVSSEVAVVEIVISPTNDAPEAENDWYETQEDSPLVISIGDPPDGQGGPMGVLANDWDVDADPLTAELQTGPAHGTLVLNPDGSFTYTPDENFNGTDAFLYQASDGQTLSDLVLVEIMVASVNDAPVGQADEYETAEDVPLVIAAEDAATLGVLANDSDVDSKSLTAQLEALASNGTVALNTDGSFTYTPNENFNGTDTFTYRVSDGELTSEPIEVRISVPAENDPPVGENDFYETNEDEPLVVTPDNSVLRNDSDPDGDALTAELRDEPEHGTLVLNPDGSFTYTPDENTNGTDTFSYVVSDGQTSSEVVQVSIEVVAVNDVPLAENDSYELDVRQVPASLEIGVPGVLANDSDAEGDALKAEIEEQPQHGSVAMQPDGSFVYTPEEGYTGTDEFTYRVIDEMDSAVATVSIAVIGENFRPRARNDRYTGEVDGELNVGAESGVLANDSDRNGDTLEARLFRGPAHGTLTLNPDGSFQYVPDEGFRGVDSFIYSATDGALRSRLAVVTIRVRPPVEIPPTAAPTDSPSPLVGEGEKSEPKAPAGAMTDSVFGSSALSDLLLSEFAI